MTTRVIPAPATGNTSCKSCYGEMNCYRSAKQCQHGTDETVAGVILRIADGCNGHQSEVEAPPETVASWNQSACGGSGGSGAFEAERPAGQTTMMMVMLVMMAKMWKKRDGVSPAGD